MDIDIDRIVYAINDLEKTMEKIAQNQEDFQKSILKILDQMETNQTMAPFFDTLLYKLDDLLTEVREISEPYKMPEMEPWSGGA